MHDPSLTPYGEEQCRHLAQHFPYHRTVNLLVASPLRRTIYTALLSFDPEITQGMKVIALPEAQETSNLPCDTGSDPETLKKEMQTKPVDLSLIRDGWNNNLGKFAPDAASIEKRAREVRQWLKARPEKEIVLVTHGGFLHYFTEDWSDSSKFEGMSRSEGPQQAFESLMAEGAVGTGWANTEFRSYQFTEEAGDNASVVEITISRERRRGTEKPLSSTEQMELRETTLKSWENSGFQFQSKV